ncbi:MAG: hypothetical protein QOK48_3145 [Blastocatellia bacterium]|jgi:hypothetical protein|nr:hypothetical protein [Blastocatellia bacterium]
MKRIAIALLLFSLLGLTGCDEEAQQYAKQLNEVLKSYQAQVAKKNNAEQEAYKGLTAFYAHAQDEELFFKLELERNERVRGLADDYAKGEKSPPTNSDLRALLKDYANYDFEQTRVSLEDESAASTRFLVNLENLEFETAKMETLSKSLEELAKPKKPLNQLKEVAVFATQVDKELQKLACDDLARAIKCLEKQEGKESDPTKKAAITAEITKLKGELTQRKGDGKCSASVDSITCPD